MKAGEYLQFHAFALITTPKTEGTDFMSYQ